MDSIYTKERTATDPNLLVECTNALADKDYQFLVMFSGGKDSVAMVLWLLGRGVAKDRITLHHHDVDGGGEQLFDWACTPSYCRAFAEAMGLKLLFSHREGGIVREIQRTNEQVQAVHYQQAVNGPYFVLPPSPHGKLSTRQKFPAISASLSTRWCSSSAKIDVASRMIANHPDYKQGKFVVLTGERREESANRAKYKECELHRCNTKRGRRVLAWRPIIDYTEEMVWDMLRRNHIQPHPAYLLGWGRCSCQLCIFSSANHWASIHALTPKKVSRIEELEQQYKHTLHHNKTIREVVTSGRPFVDLNSPWISQAVGEFTSPIFIENWTLPKGAGADHACGSV